MGGDRLFIHSPLVGPACWGPVAERLGGVVPDLRTFVELGPPWVTAFIELGSAVDSEDVSTVLTFSGSGAFGPAIARRAGATTIVFVDAVLPPVEGAWVAGEEQRQFLAGMAANDRLRPWNEWWPIGTMTELIPDVVQRREFIDELISVPLAMYDEPVPVPEGWSEGHNAYLRLSDAYTDEAIRARERGWPTISLDLDHLAVSTRPSEVADAISSLLITLSE